MKKLLYSECIFLMGIGKLNMVYETLRLGTTTDRSKSNSFLPNRKKLRLYLHKLLSGTCDFRRLGRIYWEWTIDWRINMHDGAVVLSLTLTLAVGCDANIPGDLNFDWCDGKL